jgi:hypothetical protein
MGVVMDVGLVLVLPLRVLVRRVGVREGGMIVFMAVDGHQVLHLPAHATLDVVDDVDVLVAVDELLVPVLLEPRCHRTHPLLSYSSLAAYLHLTADGGVPALQEACNFGPGRYSGARGRRPRCRHGLPGDGRRPAGVASG